MFRRKFIRLAASLLMIMALTLPVATPAGAVTGVTSIAPTTGGAGITFTLTGVDFLPGTCTTGEMTPLTTVIFDPAGTPAPATGVAVTSDTTITGTVPVHAVTGAPVAVQVNQGAPVSACTVGATTATSAPIFTYTAGTATGVSPTSGPTTGGTLITISGTGLAGTTAVTIDGVAAPITGVPTGTSVTATTGPHPVAGTFAVCVAATGSPTPNCGPAVFAYGAVTATATAAAATAVPTAVGGGNVTGTVSGVSPAGARPNAHVVLVSQTSVASFGTHTNASGAFSIAGVVPGSYRLSVADNDEDVVGCAPTAGTACGHLIFTQLVTVAAGGLAVPPITLSPKPVPGSLPAGPPAAVAGIFGEARDATTGNPAQGVVNVSGASTGSSIVGTDGRFSIGLTAAGAHTVTFLPTSGVCTAGTLTDLCTDTITVTTGGWADPAFLVVGGGVLPTPSAQGIGSGVLQGVIPLVFRDTDTSRTGGIDVETQQIRVLNAGPARTIACLDFRSSDVDGRVTTAQRQCLDLNPNAAGIFSGDIIPSGIMGMAEMFSIDFDGACTVPVPLPTSTTTATVVGTPTTAPTLTAVPTITPGTSAIQGCVYDVSDLHATIMYSVAEADNATAGTNALTCEDVQLSAIACGGGATTTTNFNQDIIIPVVFKNYGGTPAKWDSVVNVCMTSGVPGRQPVVMEFRSRAGFYLETRSADPGGCISFNMRDIAYLPDGTYSIVLTSTGLLGPTPNFNTNFILPNAMFGAAVAYSRQGRTATAHNGVAVLGGGTQITTNPNQAGLIPTNRAFLPLVFGDYTVGGGQWWTGIGVTNFPITGTSGTVNYTITIYDDAGTVRGVTAQGNSGSSANGYFWLGHQPGTENRGLWVDGQLVIPLERNFRGAAIIDAGDASQVARPIVFAHHTNYARLAAISYNAMRDEQVNPTIYGRPAQAPNTRPCAMVINISITADTCMWAAEAVRVSRGPTTGVRLFNPTGTVENIDVQYFDSAGVEWTDSRTTFTVGPFSTATIFLGTDFRLPAQFNGSLYLQSSQDVTAIANVIDYGITTRDSARAYNMPTQSGLTQ